METGQHDKTDFVLEATRNGEGLALTHTVLLVLTALSALAPFPLSFTALVAGLAAMALGSKSIADGTYRTERFTTLTERLELLPLPLVGADYRGPPPERELRIDGKNVPLRSARYVGSCEETKSGVLFKRWPVYLVFEDHVVLVRTCKSVDEAQELRGEIAAKLELPERDLEPHTDWLLAQEYPAMFSPALGYALFYVFMLASLLVASIVSLFPLDAFGSLVWGGMALAMFGIDRLFRRAMVRGIESDLDPVVEQNLDRGVFSDLRVRVEEEAEEAELVEAKAVEVNEELDGTVQERSEER